MGDVHGATSAVQNSVFLPLLDGGVTALWWLQDAATCRHVYSPQHTINSHSTKQKTHDSIEECTRLQSVHGHYCSPMEGLLLWNRLVCRTSEPIACLQVFDFVSGMLLNPLRTW
jgi:hypothetical protein